MQLSAVGASTCKLVVRSRQVDLQDQDVQQQLYRIPPVFGSIYPSGTRTKGGLPRHSLPNAPDDATEAQDAFVTVPSDVTSTMLMSAPAQTKCKSIGINNREFSKKNSLYTS
ncbi:hypothetical protein B9Z55_020291 [Caenorhabditis nigoni]|uniref:Uncharacterized protein n=1 Tax=Caenorhabditis nigoni TaxID=1611254 RepID=A0A2G5TM36_9PELO|nr:hypothetical protein B9Z55_020291 [Caenorhabditis nigoni]